LFFLGTWTRDTGEEDVFDGVESSVVEGLLGGDPALGAFPVFWVQGMEETLGNVGGFFFVFFPNSLCACLERSGYLSKNGRVNTEDNYEVASAILLRVIDKKADSEVA
jgi:hypothetical protein